MLLIDTCCFFNLNHFSLQNRFRMSDPYVEIIVGMCSDYGICTHPLMLRLQISFQCRHRTRATLSLHHEVYISIDFTHGDCSSSPCTSFVDRQALCSFRSIRIPTKLVFLHTKHHYFISILCARKKKTLIHFASDTKEKAGTLASETDWRSKRPFSKRSVC